MAFMKRFLKSAYVIAGIVVFLILLLVMVFALDVPWGEAALYSAVLTAVGIGVLVWKEYVG